MFGTLLLNTVVEKKNKYYKNNSVCATLSKLVLPQDDLDDK